MADKPQRIQLSRAKGWKMPPNTVKVDRTSRWGNPFRVEDLGRDLAVKMFENTMHGFWVPSLLDAFTDEKVRTAYKAHCEFRKRLHHQTMHRVRMDLGGKNLACWCKLGEPCHADVLLKLANGDSNG